MIEYFKQEYLLEITKQKKKEMTIYLIILGLYFLISAGLFYWYMTLPYKSSQILTIKLIHYPLTIIMFVFSIIWLAIKYKRTYKTYVTAYNLLHVKNQTSEGSFLEYDERVEDKDGVDYKALVFLEWNKFKNDYFERKVLVFEQLPLPEIPENAKVRYVTQGNVLIRYEILD